MSNPRLAAIGGKPDAPEMADKPSLLFSNESDFIQLENSPCIHFLPVLSTILGTHRDTHIPGGPSVFVVQKHYAGQFKQGVAGLSFPGLAAVSCMDDSTCAATYPACVGVPEVNGFQVVTAASARLEFPGFTSVRCMDYRSASSYQPAFILANEASLWQANSSTRILRFPRLATVAGVHYGPPFTHAPDVIRTIEEDTV